MLALEVQPENIPDTLKQIDQWVLWRYELTERLTLTKPPYQTRNPSERAYNTVPETWAPFDETLTAYLARASDFSGIAIAITADLGIVGLDLDHVSEWSDLAERIVREMDSYTERSPSGDGYRIFCYGTKPGPRCRRFYCEMYGHDRIFSVTGHTLGIRPTLEPRQDALEDVYSEFLAG